MLRELVKVRNVSCRLEGGSHGQVVIVSPYAGVSASKADKSGRFFVEIERLTLPGFPRLIMEGCFVFRMAQDDGPRRLGPPDKQNRHKAGRW